MYSNVGFGLEIESLFRKIAPTCFPTRDAINLNPCQEIDSFFERLYTDSYPETGKIRDFKINYLEGNEQKNLTDLMAVIDCENMLSDLKNIIDIYACNNH